MSTKTGSCSYRINYGSSTRRTSKRRISWRCTRWFGCLGRYLEFRLKNTTYDLTTYSLDTNWGHAFNNSNSISGPDEMVEVAEIVIDGDFELGLLMGIPMDIFEKQYDSLVIIGVLNNEQAFIEFGTYKPKRTNFLFRTLYVALRFVKRMCVTNSPSAFLMRKKDENEINYGHIN